MSEAPATSRPLGDPELPLDLPPPVPAPPTSAPPGGKGAAHKTRLMEQYRRVKEEHPDAFLFFRLGDFYELFFEDAVTGAQLLGLTLTSRNKQDAEPIPMCGLPWHQRDAYVAKLLRLGHKVAVCDQLEEAALAKGLVRRGVTEVLTPGSVVGESLLDPVANNFLAALWPTAERLGICLADISTAEVRLAECSWEEAPGALAATPAAEWLVPAGESLPPELAARMDGALRGPRGARTAVSAHGFLDLERVRRRWGPERVDALADLPAAAAAAAATLAYLDRVQGGPTLASPRIVVLDDQTTLRVDTATARNLELFQPQPGGEAAHTLWHHVNLCVTALGARRLRSWLERPLADLGALERRQAAVEAWLQGTLARGGFRESLRGLPDLERLAGRLACARATPRDLGALRDAVGRLPELGRQVEELGGPVAGRARPALQGLPELHHLLSRALVDDPPPLSKEGGIIRRGHDELRDRLDDLAHSGKRWIAELEAEERKRTGIPSLKVGFNKVFGYFIEVTRPHLDKAPADYERRQTLTTAERFVTPALKQKESEVLGAEDKLKAREHELFVELRERVAGEVVELQRAADVLATLDAEVSLAECAARYGWVRPKLDLSCRLVVEDGRHPVVERLLPRGEFVPNRVELERESRQILLLTGPNMGGKSTYLRQVALCVLLAQTGSFVPAAAAHIGLVDRLFTRVGASDRLGAGQSTFMVEMAETADILKNATPRSLVLLDELGRGTSTYDGLALAWAVTESLHAEDGPRPRTVFATHYHELTQLASTLPRLENAQVTVKEWEGGVVFLHRIAEGAADRSYGIHVAQLAGLPAAVIERARTVLAELESERTVEHLEGDARARAHLSAPTEPRSNELEEALRQMRVETLTPLQALAWLAERKARLDRT